MSIFLAKAVKIRGGWGLCPQTPGASGGSGTPLVGAPPLPNPGCATGKAYEILSLPAKFWADYATGHERRAEKLQLSEDVFLKPH